MLDTSIYDSSSQHTDVLKNICVKYMIKTNQEAEIYTESVLSKISIPDSMTLFILKAESNTEFKKLIHAIRSNNTMHLLVFSFDNTSDLLNAMSIEAKPNGLLKKPFSTEQVISLLSEIDAMAKFVDSDRVDFVFSIKAREYHIPLDAILFFESRNKRIVIRTKNSEYEYFDSLDRLEKEYADTFVRSHRSFLVNRAHISVVDYGKMEIEMDDGSHVLISRGNKDRLK